MENILVSDLMTREPITTSPSTTLLECANKMVKKKTGSLLIVNEKRLLGIISEYDILWALIKKSKEDLSKIKAIEISPKKIATIRPEARLEEAWKKMKTLKFERLPVIQDKELVGLITAKDILNFNPNLFPELDEFAQIREESNKLKLIKKAKERNTFKDGICEECGNHGLLYRINGQLICESCRDRI
jgi:CBS domain-containing protein